MDLWMPSSAPSIAAPQRDALSLQLAGYQLTTAEILYYLPDHPMLLQSYVWQDYDLAPKWPMLTQFLKFWERDLEGPLHHVTITTRDRLGDAKFSFYADEFLMN